MSSVCYWFNTNRKTIYTFLSSKIPVALKSSRFVHFWVSVTLIVENHATYIHRSVDMAKRFETPLRVFQFHLPTYLKNSTVHFPRPSLFSHSSYLFTGGYGGQRPPALFHSFPHLCPPTQSCSNWAENSSWYSHRATGWTSFSNASKRSQLSHQLNPQNTLLHKSNKKLNMCLPCKSSGLFAEKTKKNNTKLIWSKGKTIIII